MLPPPTTQEHAESHKNCGKCLLGCVFGSGRIFPPRHLKPGTATCRLSPLNVERLQSRQSQNGLAQSNTEQICPRQLICCREHDANPRIRVYCTFCLIRCLRAAGSAAPNPQIPSPSQAARCRRRGSRGSRRLLLRLSDFMKPTIGLGPQRHEISKRRDRPPQEAQVAVSHVPCSLEKLKGK